MTRKPHSSVPRLAALVVAALGLLFLLPSTRWIVAQQLRGLAAPPRPLAQLLNDLGLQHDVAAGDFTPEAGRLRAVAAERPGDYAIQLAAALSAPSAGEKLGRLHALQSRFPEEASLCAHILRCASVSEVKLRVEGTRRPVSREVAAFERAAVEGERLDPGNAYFPLMRAVGLLAANRDAEALAAIERASGKPRWDDYSAEEVRTRWVLRRGAFGERSAVPRALLWAAALHPDLTAVRAATRIAVRAAAQSESEGRKDDGLRVRRAVMRCGTLICEESSSLIGSLVGLGVMAPGTSEAGGIGSSAGRRLTSRDRRAAYLAYLRGSGWPDEAERAEAAFATADAAQEAARDGLVLSPLTTFPFIKLVTSWSIGMVVLCGAVWLVALSCASAMLARTRAQWAALAATAVVAVLLLAFMAGMAGRGVATLASTTPALASLMGVEGASGPDPTLFQILAFSVAAGIPLLSLVVLLLIGRKRHGSACAHLSRASLAGAGILLVLYAVVTASTARQEMWMNAALVRINEEEPRYYAELAGKPWPLRTP